MTLNFRCIQYFCRLYSIIGYYKIIDVIPSAIHSKSSLLILFFTCMQGKLLQLCLTLYDPIHCSQPGSSVHGILQARILEWVAISSSRGSSWTRIEPTSLTLAGVFFTTSATWKIPYFYTVVFICQCHTTDLSLPTSASPSGNHKFVFCICESVCLLHITYLYYVLDSTYEWCHIIFVFLCLTYFTKHIL